jgi:hypothetical protein
MLSGVCAMACDENDSGGLWWTGGWSEVSILVPCRVQFCSYASTKQLSAVDHPVYIYPIKAYVYEKVVCMCMFCQKKRPILKFFTVGR